MGQSAEELRRDIEYTRGDLSDTLDAIGDRVSPGRMVERRKNRVVYGIQSVRDRVMGTASNVSNNVSGAGEAVSDQATGAVDTLKATPDTVRQQTQGNPLAAGAIAFGVGVLMASIFPASEKEKQATGQLMDKAEPLKEELKQAGQDIAEHLKEPTRDAVEQVKQTAAEGKQAVTDSAKEAAGTTQQTARDAADNLRSEATDDQHEQPR